MDDLGVDGLGGDGLGVDDPSRILTLIHDQSEEKAIDLILYCILSLIFSKILRNLSWYGHKYQKKQFSFSFPFG